jgi:hypothetical protein
MILSNTHNHVKIAFPLVPPPGPSGTIICTSLNLHSVRKLSCEYDLFWLCGSQGETFLMTSPNLCIFVIISRWRGPGPLLVQFKIPFTQRWFVPSLIEIGLLVLEKIFFSDINTSEYGFPYCGPIQPPGTMIWRNLNLHYIRKLSSKYMYDLFWLSGSGEENF